MKNLKYFVLSVDKLLSLVLFYCQARFSEVLRDIIYSRLKRLSDRYIPVVGKCKIDPGVCASLLKELELHGYPRGHFPGASSMITFKELPDSLKEIIDQNRESIAKYLGKNFFVDVKNTVLWRDFNIQESLSGYDIYSNVWHQDSHDGNRLLKIFVNIENVSFSDGPIMWLSEASTRRNWAQMRDRWSFKVFKGVCHIDDEQALIGPAGSYAIVDTARLLHRASIPDESRVTLAVAIYPSWRNKT